MTVVLEYELTFPVRPVFKTEIHVNSMSPTKIRRGRQYIVIGKHIFSTSLNQSQRPDLVGIALEGSPISIRVISASIFKTIAVKKISKN